MLLVTQTFGDAVVGVTGLVITFRPGIIRMDRDLPEKNLHRGDRILTYTYRGEGYSAVWLHGRYDSDFDISFAKWPDGQGCGGEHCAATYLYLGKKVWDGIDMLAKAGFSYGEVARLQIRDLCPIHSQLGKVG